MPARFPALCTSAHPVQKCAFLNKDKSSGGNMPKQLQAWENGVHKRQRAEPRKQAGMQGHKSIAELRRAALTQDAGKRPLPWALGIPPAPQHSGLQAKPCPLHGCCPLGPDTKRSGKSLCRRVSLFMVRTSSRAPSSSRLSIRKLRLAPEHSLPYHTGVRSSTCSTPEPTGTAPHTPANAPSDGRVSSGIGTFFQWKVHTGCKSVRRKPSSLTLCCKKYLLRLVPISGELLGPCRGLPPRPNPCQQCRAGRGQPRGPFCGRLCLSRLLRLRLLALAWEFLPQTNHHLRYSYRRGHRPSIILPS